MDFRDRGRGREHLSKYAIVYIYIYIYIYTQYMYIYNIRRPSGVLDESEVKPPFSLLLHPPKNAREKSPQGGGGPRILFFMEDAEPARSGVDAAGGEFRRL